MIAKKLVTAVCLAVALGGAAAASSGTAEAASPVPAIVATAPTWIPQGHYSTLAACDAAGQELLQSNADYITYRCSYVTGTDTYYALWGMKYYA